MRLLAFLALALSLIAPASHAEIGVIDGATIDVNGTPYRLWGIDAPENFQQCFHEGRMYPCGHDAARHLQDLLGRCLAFSPGYADPAPAGSGCKLACEPRATDHDRRTVAVCRIGDVDLGAAMVRDGWAVAYLRDASDYAPEEQEARAAKRGLWSGRFDLPWEWRAWHRRPSP